MSTSIASSALAILRLDIVGYSRIVGADNEDAVRRVENEMADIRHLLERWGGRIWSRSGDSFLATFPTVRDALHSAFDLQERPTDGVEPLMLRVGVHVGDVFIAGEEVAGNAVNIAVRLETLAAPGGICISRAVHDLAAPAFRNRFIRHGLARLKNIDREIEVFVTPHTVSTATNVGTSIPNSESSVAEQPKVLVRPFVALSDDSRTTCFATGFTTDLIARLSRFRHLDVIGRASSYALNLNALDRSAASQVGARYVVGGQFQIIGTRLRATALLADATNEKVIWSESYARDLDDIFEVQADMVDVITASMAVNIDQAEKEIARARNPDSLDAYGFVLFGRLENLEDGATGREATARAMHCFTRATECDPFYAAAIAGLARTHSVQWRLGWSDDRSASMQYATDYALQAIETDVNDAVAHSELGFVSLYRREFDRSLAAYEQALRLNPSDVEIIAFYADALKHNGMPEKAIPLFKRALDLNPLRPDIYLGNLAHAYFVMGDFETSIQTIAGMRQPLTAQRVLIASLMLAGRENEGRLEAQKLKQQVPDFSAKEWSRIVPDRLPEHSELLRAGLERAGF